MNSEISRNASRRKARQPLASTPMEAMVHSPLCLVPAHTSKKTQPFRQDVCSFGLDENFAAVEGNAGAQFPADVKHGWFLQQQETKG